MSKNTPRTGNGQQSGSQKATTSLTREDVIEKAHELSKVGLKKVEHAYAALLDLIEVGRWQQQTQNDHLEYIEAAELHGVSDWWWERSCVFPILEVMAAAQKLAARNNETDDVKDLNTDIEEMEASIRRCVLTGQTNMMLDEGISLEDEVLPALRALAGAMGGTEPPKADEASKRLDQQAKAGLR